MRKIFGRVAFTVLLLGLSIPAPAQATNAAAPATNAPGAAAPLPGVPLPEVVAVAVDDASKLKDIQASLATDKTVTEVQATLVTLTQSIDQRKAEADKALDATTSLTLLRSTQEAWETLGKNLDAPQQTLSTRLTQLSEIEAQLAALDKKWKDTRASAKTSAAPADVLARIDAIISAIGQTGKTLAQLRGQIWSTQSQVASQNARVVAELALIQTAQKHAFGALFIRDSSPIWAPGAIPASAGANPNPLPAEWVELRAYMADKFPAALIHLALFIALALVLFFVRRQVAVRNQDDPAVQHAAQVFEVPIAVAAVLALLLSGWFYPLAPPLFRAGLGAAALFPAVIILRRLIEPSLLPILYAMVLGYVADLVRYVLDAQPLLARSLFLFEMLVAILFLVWLIRSRRLSHVKNDPIERIVHLFAIAGLVVFSFALLANILGYTKLGILFGGAMLGSSYLAVILYAAVRIADGLLLAALRIRPLSNLGMVRRHSGAIASRASTVVRWATFYCWGYETLEMFSLRALVQQRAWSVLTYTQKFGALNLALWPILLFGVTIWATLLISRFVRFVLEEEVYPNLHLGPGVPYATSTMVHYAILVIGTLFALSAVDIDLSKYSVLAGALGVGLGFGLQNIMNNFVSGIILLFERPVKVGDIIQVDTAVGTVEKIGIRASVIRITNGSEIIMPNGSLISNQVTNWTFSDRRRALDLPVSVSPKAEPQQVMNLLIATAKAHPKVLHEPPPQVLFTNFTATALNFELRAWADTTESWAQVRSDLSLSISAALARENIPMT